MARLILTIYLLFVGLLCNATAEDDQEPFYTKIGSTVIRLEHFVESTSEGNDKTETTNNPDGTGFFINSDNRLFLVTARHVVDTDHDLHARVKIFNEVSNNYEIVLLELPRNHWVFHPNNGDARTNAVDIAAIKLPIPGIEGSFLSRFTAFEYDSNNSKHNQLPLKDALPPVQVVTFGFPGDIGFQLFEQRPMGRLGIISMYTGEKFIKVGEKYANEKCSILDIKAFPGNSGSPVISVSGETKLLGIVIASNNSDIAIMEPTSHIRELIDTAKKVPIKDYGYWKKIQLNNGQ